MSSERPENRPGEGVSQETEPEDEDYDVEFEDLQDVGDESQDLSGSDLSQEAETPDFAKSKDSPHSGLRKSHSAVLGSEESKPNVVEQSLGNDKGARQSRLAEYRLEKEEAPGANEIDYSYDVFEDSIEGMEHGLSTAELPVLNSSGELVRDKGIHMKNPLYESIYGLEALLSGKPARSRKKKKAPRRDYEEERIRALQFALVDPQEARRNAMTPRGNISRSRRKGISERMSRTLKPVFPPWQKDRPRNRSMMNSVAAPREGMTRKERDRLLRQRERLWDNRARLGRGSYKPYDAITDYHCRRVGTSRQFLQTAGRNRNLSAEARFLIGFRRVLESRASQLKPNAPPLGLKPTPPRLMSKLEEREVESFPSPRKTPQSARLHFNSQDKWNLLTASPSQHRIDDFAASFDPDYSSPSIRHLARPGTSIGLASPRSSTPVDTSSPLTPRSGAKSALGPRTLTRTMTELSELGPFEDEEDSDKEVRDGDDGEAPGDVVDVEEGQDKDLVFKLVQEQLVQLWEDLRFPTRERELAEDKFFSSGSRNALADIVGEVARLTRFRLQTIKVLRLARERRKTFEELMDGPVELLTGAAVNNLRTVFLQLKKLHGQWREFLPWNEALIFEGNDAIEAAYADHSVLKEHLKQSGWDLHHVPKLPDDEVSPDAGISLPMRTLSDVQADGKDVDNDDGYGSGDALEAKVAVAYKHGVPRQGSGTINDVQ